MRLTALRAAGLSEEEAKVYSLLLESGSQTAGAIFKNAGLKRGTVYQVFRGLEHKHLVSESMRGAKILFSPEAPDALLDGAKIRKEEATRAEAELVAALPKLKTAYLAVAQKPILHFYEGVEGLKAIYELHLEVKQDLWFLRTRHARDYEKFFGKWWAHYVRRRASAGIVTYGLTPDTPDANHDPAIDAAKKFVRTWLRPEDYTAPVEIDVFGEIVAIISFGKEIFGLTMENAAIAQSFRQMFGLMKRGAQK